ncbi:MAG: RagB/SusD family nutrient uptake outer membrane protein [Cruoricaptor ignavus]|nr:RagB/SusD family nutrient uptake outer membrane protein [Cruoricaptor ignavus]
MKKIIKLVGVAALSFAVLSCNNFGEEILDTDAKSTLPDYEIFANPGLTELALDGVKMSFGETNSYRGRFLPWYGLNTDSEWYNSSESTSNDNADLCVYDAKPNNSQMNTVNNAWAMIYQGIERANIAIQGIRAYGNPQPGNEMGYLLGEALTLRAIFYADLLKAWGDVPARFTPVDNNNLYEPKSSRDIIYKQLIADLAEASDLVPWPNGNSATTSVERINKAFVKGLRAKLALAASGYQQYPDGVRRSTDPELSVQNMYKIALDESRSVINSGTSQLNPSYEDVWRRLMQENTSAGGESLWEIPFAAGRGRMVFVFGINHQTANQYHEAGNNRGGQIGPLPNVFYDFDEKDLRRDITCVPYRWGRAVNGVAKQELGSFNRWYFGKYRYEWMTRRVTSQNDDGINKLYMRLAEVYLMAAETANELEGPSAAAPYLRAVRSRAFGAADQAEKVNNYINNLTSKQTMFDAIVKEHEFEFTGEMERKQALIRWNKLGANMAEAKQKMTRLRNREGEYADVPTVLYYTYESDGETLKIYGLNRGEYDSPGTEYTQVNWSSLSESKINALYRNDPDTKQFWPIWQVFIERSNGLLTNDYGY